jgi:hypothetical protein
VVVVEAHLVGLFVAYMPGFRVVLAAFPCEPDCRFPTGSGFLIDWVWARHISEVPAADLRSDMVCGNLLKRATDHAGNPYQVMLAGSGF